MVIFISDNTRLCRLLGDYRLVIQKEILKLKQDENWNLNLEIILLITHGILHIYNYDHEEEKNRIDMENIQDSLVSDTRRTFKL